VPSSTTVPPLAVRNGLFSCVLGVSYLGSFISLGTYIKWTSRKQRCTFSDISSHFDHFKPHTGCYNYPRLKCTTSSLCLTNRQTYESFWPAVHTQYLCPTKWLPMGFPSTSAAHGRESTLIPSVMPQLPSGPRQLSRTTSMIIDWPHKSPQSLSDVLHPGSHAVW